MSQRNLLEEVEARLRYVPRWRLILGIVLLIPPFSIVGMAILAYEFLRAGEPLREAEGESLVGGDAAAEVAAVGDDAAESDAVESSAAEEADEEDA
jgi:ABC-type Na+ efflux pump permease subunit